MHPPRFSLFHLAQNSSDRPTERLYDFDERICLMAFGTLEHAKVKRSMELLAREVMPAFGPAAQRGAAR